MRDAPHTHGPAGNVSPDYRPARKYSVTIAGHETSIRLEPAFWEALVGGARRLNIPVNALIARIDAARIESDKSGAVPNLASALRLWALAERSRLQIDSAP